MSVAPYDDSMTLTINGTPTEVPTGESVAALLDRLGVGSQPCAVEVNRDVVPRRQHADRVLREGDVVEVVTLVGGG